MAGIVNEAYTLDVNVQESGAAEQDVNVRSWNDAGTSVLDKTTDASGDVTSTILIAEEHSITLTSTRNTTVFNPFQLRALKWVTPTVLEVLNVEINLAAATKQTLFASVNGNITETTEATVQAYTGLTFNHTSDTVTTDGTGGTPVDTVDELYDACQEEAINNEQVTPAEVLATVDKQNYALEYDWTINGHSFNGQSRTISPASTNTLTVQAAGGTATNLEWTGDVVFSTGWDATSLTNFDIGGDGDLSAGGTPRTITLTDCQWDSVTSSTSGWTLNLSGDSSVTTNNSPGNVTILNTKNFTVTDLDTGSRVVFLTRPGETELDNQVESGGEVTYSFSYTVDTDIWISILSLDKRNRLIEAQLLNQDQTLGAGQSDDVVYSNP